MIEVTQFIYLPALAGQAGLSLPLFNNHATRVALVRTALELVSNTGASSVQIREATGFYWAEMLVIAALKSRVDEIQYLSLRGKEFDHQWRKS